MNSPRFPHWLLARLLFPLCASAAFAAALPIDEEAPWPRVRSTNGSTVTLFQPQVERWTSNWFSARAAVEVKLAKAKSNLVGVVWFEAHESVDCSNRLVRLESLEITKGRFPEAPDNGSNALAVVRQVVPSCARTVSLDYLIAVLGFNRAAARQGPSGIKNAAPEIIWATNRTVLVLIDGEPVLRRVAGSALQRVINTPALLVYDGSKFYLTGEGLWFAADGIQGPWSLAQTPPPEVAALSPAPAGGQTAGAPELVPRILVRTHPAELLMTSGLPEYKPIRGTALQYAADTDSQLFFHNAERQVYLLLSGRWFKAQSLHGPWTYVSPHDLPADFARIPPGTPQAVVLASVPDTPQADLAVLGNSVPVTATVDRHDATIQLAYDGAPEFKRIEGTSMSYALNAQLPVIQLGSAYYALDNGVWFLASSPTGPWQVATHVPQEIYSIPPSSPVYYATFAEVYHSNDDEVEVGYTAGYQGAYENDGTMVYGTGYDYAPWYGDSYYGWGWTWGYGYVYVPWYQWWVWRPWWNQPGGLRAAVIENIYDRWRGRNGITHYDGSAALAGLAPTAPRAPRAPLAPTAPTAPSAPGAPSAPRAPNAPGAPSAPGAPFAPGAPLAPTAPLAGYPGYPALYGRVAGSASPSAMHPPPNTLALNPYSRPSSYVRPREIPHGAQLLTTVRRAPGGGRDLYASPDGNIYRRADNGWYRRDTGGKWNFYAPAKGQLENQQLASARGAQGAGAVYRPAARQNAAAGRVPNAGTEARPKDVAELERQYYARSLAQMRAQNWRASGNFARPVVISGGRRR